MYKKNQIKIEIENQINTRTQLRICVKRCMYISVYCLLLHSTIINYRFINGWG